MLFLSAEEIKQLMEIDNDAYHSIFKPIQPFFLDICDAIEDIDQATILKLNNVQFHINNKIAYYSRIIDRIKRHVYVLQYNIIASATKKSEIVMDIIHEGVANKQIKVCLDKKKVGASGYDDYDFLDISKTELSKFAHQLIMQHYNIYFDKPEFKNLDNQIYEMEELQYRVKILNNVASYLNNLNYNIK